MRLRPGAADEYRRRHDLIWPELAALLKDAGARDYSIYLDPDGTTLFAVVSEDVPGGLDALRDDPLMRRWWTHMASLMAVEADDSPVIETLEPMFHLA